MTDTATEPPAITLIIAGSGPHRDRLRKEVVRFLKTLGASVFDEDADEPDQHIPEVDFSQVQVVVDTDSLLDGEPRCHSVGRSLLCSDFEHLPHVLTGLPDDVTTAAGAAKECAELLAELIETVEGFGGIAVSDDKLVDNLFPRGLDFFFPLCAEKIS